MLSLALRVLHSQFPKIRTTQHKSLFFGKSSSFSGHVEPFHYLSCLERHLNLNIKKNLGHEERTISTSCSTTLASPRLTRHGIFSDEGGGKSDVSIIRV